jgi:hypothetical protein
MDRLDSLATINRWALGTDHLREVLALSLERAARADRQLQLVARVEERLNDHATAIVIDASKAHGVVAGEALERAVALVDVARVGACALIDEARQDIGDLYRSHPPARGARDAEPGRDGPSSTEAKQPAAALDGTAMSWPATAGGELGAEDEDALETRVVEARRRAEDAEALLARPRPSAAPPSIEDFLAAAERGAAGIVEMARTAVAEMRSLAEAELVHGGAAGQRGLPRPALDAVSVGAALAEQDPDPATHTDAGPEATAASAGPAGLDGAGVDEVVGQHPTADNNPAEPAADAMAALSVTAEYASEPFAAGSEDELEPVGAVNASQAEPEAAMAASADAVPATPRDRDIAQGVDAPFADLAGLPRGGPDEGAAWAPISAELGADPRVAGGPRPLTAQHAAHAALPPAPLHLAQPNTTEAITATIDASCAASLAKLAALRASLDARLERIGAN